MKTAPSISSSEVRNYKFDESIGYLLMRVKSIMLNMITQQSMAELGITSTQGRMLFMISSGRCEFAAELARECGIDASSVTRLADRLEKLGLLTKIRSSEDRREVKLTLTDKGHSTASRMSPIFSGVLESLLSGFTMEEVESLKSMLRRVLANSGELSDLAHNEATNIRHK